MKPEKLHKTPEERKLRSRQRRDASENELVSIGIILFAAVIGCVIFIGDVGRGRTFAGLIILCVAVPMMAIFWLHEPFWNFVRRLREKSRNE